MTRLQRNLLGIVSLAAAGFISGIVSPVFPPGMSWQVAVFPAIMAAALWLACGMRSIPRAILFFFAGLGSYYLALRVSWAALYFSPFRFFDYFDPESPGFISDKVAFGGIAGSAVVIAAFYASFLPHLDWRRWLWKSLLWSGMGGLLAFAGWLLENKLYLPEFGFIVVTWQTGMGALLGTLLWLEKRSATTASQENSAPISPVRKTAGLGIVCVLALLSVYGVSQRRQYYIAALAKRAAAAEEGQKNLERANAWKSQQAHQRQELIDQSTAEAPPGYETASVTKMAADKVLILPGINRIYIAQIPTVTAIPRRNEQGWDTFIRPASVSYRVRYERPPGTEAPSSHPGVIVEVTHYPNQSWAKYELRNTPSPNMGIDFPPAQPARMFENNIFLYRDKKTGLAPVYYWASGDKLVVVRCHREGELVLKRYLMKYPSSLPAATPDVAAPFRN